MICGGFSGAVFVTLFTNLQCLYAFALLARPKRFFFGCGYVIVVTNNVEPEAHYSGRMAGEWIGHKCGNRLVAAYRHRMIFVIQYCPL